MTLWLIPTLLGDDASETSLSPQIRTVLSTIRHFVVENEKTARAFLKRFPLAGPIQELSLVSLNEHTPQSAVARLLTPALNGEEMGLLSEAGCPCIADPGHLLVREAHKKGVLVKPLVGPSSILLALIASGLDGQQFSFHGYLPINSEARQQKFQTFIKHPGSHVFIETPYRTDRLLSELVDALPSNYYLSLSVSLTTPDEFIRTASIAEWRKERRTVGKQPAVFVVGRP